MIRPLFTSENNFFVVGTTFIIVGTHLINKANSDPMIFVDEKIMGIVLKSSGFIVDIGALVIILLCLKEMNQIKKVLGNTEVKIGVIKYCPRGTLSNPDGLLIPEILLTVRF